MVDFLNGKPKISIILPVYNVEDYLSKCLDSCVNQTIYDIEIICVNDGSTDNSLKTLEAYQETDNRIIIINQKNEGLSHARNTGLSIAQGEVIMFLDSDDFLSQNACERVFTEFLEANTDIVIFGTNIFPSKPMWNYWLEENLTSIKTERFYKFKPWLIFEKKGTMPFVWRQAYSKEFIDKFQLSFVDKMKLTEDAVFQLCAFPHAKNLAYIEDRLYNYRWYREDSIMSDSRKDPNIAAEKHLIAVKNILEYWDKQHWLEKYGYEITKFVFDYSFSRISSAKRSIRKTLSIETVEIIEKYKLIKYIKNDDKYVLSILKRLGYKQSNKNTLK